MNSIIQGMPTQKQALFEYNGTYFQVIIYRYVAKVLLHTINYSLHNKDFRMV